MLGQVFTSMLQCQLSGFFSLFFFFHKKILFCFCIIIFFKSKASLGNISFVIGLFFCGDGHIVMESKAAP